MQRIILALLLFPALGLSAQVRYNVVNLQTFGAVGPYSSYAFGINDAGVTIGDYNAPDRSVNLFRHEDATGMLNLGNLGGGTLNGTGINNSGQIAAYGTTVNGGNFQAVRYSPGIGFVPLGSLGVGETETSGINNQGQVTGFSERTDGFEHAFRYTDGIGMQDLGSLYGGHSIGYAINDLGWVTGKSDGNTFLYRDDVGMTYLGPGTGYAINNLGVVAGEAEGPAIFRDGGVWPLGDLGGHGGIAAGINDLNQVVGTGYISRTFHGFLWTEQEGMVDLNSIIDPESGWTLSTATAINEAGQIIGNGLFDGKSFAYRLDPIPEPSTWALLGLGGFLSMLFHRRLKR